MADVELDTEDDMTSLLVGLAHLVVCIGLCWYCCPGWLCCRCCCKKRIVGQTGNQEPPIEPAIVAEIKDLQPRKQLFSAYILWLFGGILGIHHFYLERFAHGILAQSTLNFLLIGWVADVFFLPMYVRRFNEARTAPAAPPDFSRRQLCCKLPMLVIAAFGFLAYVVCFLPATLHYFKAIDIDRLAAQTEENPYQVLGITGSAEFREAKTAYHKLSLKWHPDRNQNCGKECDDKMAEITKAFELIKKRKAPRPADETWQAWMGNIFDDWQILGSYVADKVKAWEDTPQTKPKTTSDKGKRGPQSDL